MQPTPWVPLEGTNPLLPHHPSEILIGIILVGVIWIILAKWVVPAFEANYEKRSDQIAGNIERAEKAKAEADAARAKYQEQLDSARQEAAQIREDAKATGDQLIAEAKARATAEADRIMAQAHQQIKAERQQAEIELRREVGGMATTLAGRVVGESLSDDAKAQATIDRFIAELETGDVRAEDASL